VLRELLPDAVNEAIAEHSLNALGEPNVQLDNTEALERLGDEPLTVRVELEVLPEVTLSEYKGLEATRRTRQVTDADVDKLIEAWRDSSASLEPIEDRPAELGDIVTVNARGKELDQADAEEFNVDEVQIELGGVNVQKEFTDNLLGVHPDDTRTFLVEYPEDFSTPGLAGKKVEYVTHVISVQKRVLPELDDEWVQSLGAGFDSVEILKTKAREDLEARATMDSDRRLRDELLRKLLDAHPFEVPETLVEHQTNQRMQSLAQQMMSQGYDPRSQNLDWERAREEVRGQAEGDVRASMLLEEIAEAENITVSDEEVEAEFEAIATASQQPLEQVRAALTKDGGERSIAHRLRNRKALDLLIENARVTDAEWTQPTTENEDAEPASE